MKRLFPLFAVAAIGLSVLPGCSLGQADAALVNGQALTRRSVDSELKDLAHNTAFVKAIDAEQGGPGPVQATVAGTFSQSFVALVLTQRIQDAVVHQEVERRHAMPDAAALTTAQQEVDSQYTLPATATAAAQPLLAGFTKSYQNTLVERQAETDALSAALAKTVGDTAARQYYDTHQAQFVTELCVRAILVADQATATRIKAQLDAGGDFAALAKADSTDATTAAKGGALGGSAADGCLNGSDLQQLQQLDATFSQAVLSLPVNQVSEPVQSGSTFDLIEVTSHQVAPYNAQAAQAARQQLAVPLRDDLLQRASVKVDPAFGTYDRTGTGGPAVVPPSGPQLPTGSVTGATTATTAAPGSSAG